MASTSEPIVILDDEPTPSTRTHPGGSTVGETSRRANGKASTSGAGQHKRKRGGKGKASGLDCTEVVDLTAASPSRSKKAVPDIEIVRTKIVKKPRAQPRVNQVQRPRGVGQAILTGLTTMASVLPRMQNTVRSAPPPPEPNPPTTSNGLECRICIDSLKQPAATPCGHVFCYSCLTAALRVKKQCPVCRKSIRSVRQIHRLYL